MASSPIPSQPLEDETPLTREQAWELLWSLEGSMEGWFPDEGGASGVLQKERDAWGE